MQPAISSPGSSSSVSALTNGSSGNMTNSSPLNRLQNMQPFDYRKAAAAAAAAAADLAAKGDIERPIPPTMHPGLRMPAGAAAMAGLAAAAGMPLLPTVSGVSPSLAASYQNTIASMASKVRLKCKARPHACAHASEMPLKWVKISQLCRSSKNTTFPGQPRQR